MATAATRPESAPIRKTRGLDEPVVPLERAADVAHMAKVALVETTPPESAPAAAPVANAVAAPLRAISKPEPQFPATALKEGVREGRVLATLTVNGDGSIGKVDIVESQPRNVFDKEVRKVLAAWRYEAPGQPRHATVEFVFKREE
jgi:protein TonB